MNDTLPPAGSAVALDPEPAVADFVQRARRLFITEGFLNETFVSLSGGAFMTGLAVYLGAGPLILSWLTALPFAVQVFQLAGPFFERKLESRKRFVVPAIAGSRLLWLVPSIVVLTDLHGDVALVLWLAALLAMSIIGMIGVGGWTPWMAEVIPDRHRARLFGARQWAVSFATLVIMPIGAIIMDTCKARENEALGYAIIGVLAVLAGAGAGLTLRKFPDVAPVKRPPEHPWRALRELLHRPKFRPVFWFFLAWNFAIAVPAPFWTLFQMERLNMSFTLITVYTCMVLAVRVALNNAWSRLIDRVGSHRVVIASALGVSGIPLIWLLPTADNLWPIWFEAIVSGMFWTGFIQASFIQPMAALEPHERSRGLALLNVGTGFAFFTSSLLGGMIIHYFQSGTEAVWASRMGPDFGYHVLFVISATLRAATALWGLRLHEPGVKFHGFLVQFIGYGVLRRASVGRQWIPVDGDKSG